MNQTVPNHSMKGKAKQTLDNDFNIGGTVQHPVITPFGHQITEENFQIGGSNVAKKSVFDKLKGQLKGPCSDRSLTRQRKKTKRRKPRNLSKLLANRKKFQKRW